MTCPCGCGRSVPKPKTLRPSTNDGRSLPCVRCGTSTPDAMYYGGMPMCDNCGSIHGHERADEDADNPDHH